MAQRWALALFGHPQRPDGLYYRSRHDPSRLCVAVYEWAQAALTAVRLGSLTEPALAAQLAELLDTYRFALVDDTT